MIKQEELRIKPNMKPGAFSCIDQLKAAPGQPQDAFFCTPKKEELKKKVEFHMDDNKENIRNEANKPSPARKPKSILRSNSFKKKSGIGLENSNGQRKDKSLLAPKIEKKNEKSEQNSEEILGLREELDVERKKNLENKKRINNEKTIINNLKVRIKTLEDEKAKLEESYRRSLMNIEQKTATLRNTNQQWASKAEKFDALTKEVADIQTYKATLRENLK
jgi:hypothetical protein